MQIKGLDEIGNKFGTRRYQAQGPGSGTRLRDQAQGPKRWKSVELFV